MTGFSEFQDQNQNIYQLVNKDNYINACYTAYEDINRFDAILQIDIDFILKSPPVTPTKKTPVFVGTRSSWALRFAQIIGQVGASIIWRELPKGFSSWLMVIDNTVAIAVDFKQMRGWSQDFNRVSNLDIQISRAVLHEVGHIKLTPYLLGISQEDGGRVPPADPEDEVAPWAYAFAIIGILLSAYARNAHFKRKTEDTPSILA
jgi:hypothetical protein